MEYEKIKSILKIILALNWLVAFAKIFLGLYLGALSIFSDGLHSLFDGVSNIIGLLGIKLAEKPIDKDHPYGHQKYEAVASLGILFLLTIVAYEVSKSIISKLFHPEAIYVDWLVFGTLMMCLIIDGLVARYECRKGVELKSVILRADASHTKSHYITTGAVILGMLLMKLGLPSIIDPIIAVLVVGFIIRLGYAIFKETTGILSDKALVNEETIRQIAEGFETVKSCRYIRTRGDERHIFMDFCITFDKDISLAEAHKICDQVEEKIKASIPEVKDIIIHIEPH